jgi:hypothetical protein
VGSGWWAVARNGVGMPEVAIPPSVAVNPEGRWPPIPKRFCRTAQGCRRAGTLREARSTRADGRIKLGYLGRPCQLYRFFVRAASNSDACGLCASSSEKPDSDENARFDACNGFFEGENMRLLGTFGATLLLATLATAGQSWALETSYHRLRMLAARQDLRNMVCYAMADGSINGTERTTILMEAKGVLSREEYVKFKTALDRASPPPKPSPSHLVTATRKKPASTRMPPQRPSEPPPGPVIPAGVFLPD